MQVSFGTCSLSCCCSHLLSRPYVRCFSGAASLPWLTLLLTSPCCAVEVQKMLLAEEQEAHQQRITSSSMAGGSISDVHSALLRIHETAIYQQALLQHAECVLAPAVAAMRALAMQADLEVQQLEADNSRLQVGACWWHTRMLYTQPLVIQPVQLLYAAMV